MTGSPWHILLVEELELIVSKHVNAALKDELGEQHMPERLIVVATSNDASGLDEALLQRFEVFPFSAGPTFAEACQERLAWIWEQEVGADVPLPAGVEQLGWRNGSFSMRRAPAAPVGPSSCIAQPRWRRKPATPPSSCAAMPMQTGRW